MYREKSAEKSVLDSHGPRLPPAHANGQSGADPRAAQDPTRMGVTIAVANQKGGVGKTTTTANLGASLAIRGRRVLLVDMDPQGNLTSAFGLEKDVQQTVAESLLDRRVPLPVVTVQNGANVNGHQSTFLHLEGATPLAVVPAAVGL